MVMVNPGAGIGRVDGAVGGVGRDRERLLGPGGEAAGEAGQLEVGDDHRDVDPGADLADLEVARVGDEEVARGVEGQSG